MRLVWKITLFSLLVAVIPLSIAGWKVISRVRSEYPRTPVQTRVKAEAAEIAHRIDTPFIDRWVRTARMFTRALEIRQFDPARVIDTEPLFRAAVEAFPAVVAVQVFPDVDDYYNVTVFNTRVPTDVLSEDDVKEDVIGSDIDDALTAAQTSQIYIGNADRSGILDEYLLTIGVPWTQSDGTIGAVIARLTLRNLCKEICIGTRKDVQHSVVIDAAGRVLSRYEGISTSESSNAEFLAAIDAVKTQLHDWTRGELDGITQPVGISLPPQDAESRQPEYHTAYALCSTVPWAVILHEPVDNAVWNVSQIVHDVSVWLAVALIIAILGGLFLSRAIGRPIKKLTNAVREIGMGNFDHRVSLDRQDEFGELADGFNSMAQRLKLFDGVNVGKILREKSKLETIVHNIADGVILTGPDGEVLAMNEPVERWFGVRESECLNHLVADCVEVSELTDLINETANDLEKRVHAHELSLEIPGTVHTTMLNARAMRVHTDTGETVGVTTILRDVTVEREVDRVKTELLSIVAHELRSPLVSIMGFSGILLEKDLDLATRLEFASTVNREANRMVEMINRFLDISRIESGKTALSIMPADVTEIVREVVKINNGMADDKTIQIEMQVPNRVTQVLADRELIGQAFLNVLSNAVKYSAANTTIRITVTEHRNTIEVSVKDQGYGITPGNQKRLFEKFFRVTDDPNVRDITGTGLGLPFVKEVVEQHGGRVHVESAVGAGSTVSFHLPKNWS